MSDPKDRMKKELQKLAILLKKAEERNANMSFLSEEERAMFKNFSFLINRFGSEMDYIPPDFSDEMTESFTQMIRNMIDALQEELGEEGIYLTEDEKADIDDTPYYDDTTDAINIDKSFPLPSAEELIEKIDSEIPMKHRIMMAIQKIDSKLTPDADPEMADELLDRRLELLEELRKYS